jgi:hypothetical protein
VIQKTETMSEEMYKSILVHRRCVLLAVVGVTDPSSPSISRLLEHDYLLFVKKWLDEILSGSIGGVDLLLHLLKNIASLPVTKSVVKSSNMGKLIGSLEKHSMCSNTPNAPVIKELIQQVKDSWSSSVKARKSQDQPEKAPQVVVEHAPTTEATPIPKRPSESIHADETASKRAKLAVEPKKSSSSSFSSLLKKVSGSSTGNQVASSPQSNEPNGDTKSNGAATQSQAKKVSKRVKWADHFGGNLSVAQALEADDSVDGASAAATGSDSSWSDRKKRDRLREKELLATAK